MIRKIAITAALAASLIYLGAEFNMRALSYGPLEELKLTEAAEETASGAEAGGDRGWSEAILGMNLFDPMRAAPPPVPEVSAQPVEQPAPPEEQKRQPQVELNGIILNQYGERVAYLKIDNAPPVAAQKGDSLGEILVVDITEKDVELKWDDKPISLTLEKIKNVKKPDKEVTDK